MFDALFTDFSQEWQEHERGAGQRECILTAMTLYAQNSVYYDVQNGASRLMLFFICTEKTF